MRGTLLTNSGDVKFNIAFVNNLEAINDPGVNDDASKGYSVGSTWVNTDAGTVFTCTSAAKGAAVWAAQGGAIGSQTQGAPAAKTVSGVLTGADLLAGIITVNQGAGAPSAQQLPTGADLQAALPDEFAVNDAFEFSVINTSTVDVEDATVTANTGFTIVGSGDIPAHSGATLSSSATFRVRKTADATFVAYRIG